ncbi:hypothetical protein Molly5_133 [Maribacter phage Molly_5]|nr:hypothetical protein Molly4_133 [Maribacter phage Molly_4]QQO98226.1 hypothetical protein Molly5_133 [Maribacter phage Molly_5]
MIRWRQQTNDNVLIGLLQRRNTTQGAAFEIPLFTNKDRGRLTSMSRTTFVIRSLFQLSIPAKLELVDLEYDESVIFVFPPYSRAKIIIGTEEFLNVYNRNCVIAIRNGIKFTLQIDRMPSTDRTVTVLTPGTFERLF